MLRVAVNNVTEEDKQVTLMAERLMKKWTRKQVEKVNEKRKKKRLAIKPVKKIKTSC